MNPETIRNLCIIAHVDHGKTSLVEQLLKQSGNFSEKEQTFDKALDNNDLEKERGITILSKNVSMNLRGVKVNIVDTPGHADFGGEVERIMGSVEGAILLVDAAEGPLPQTRFVLEKAIQKGHKILVCINKVDRRELKDDHGERIAEVLNQIFDLFIELGASEEQCDFPVFYCCARDGWCTPEVKDITPILENEKKHDNLTPLMKSILDHLPSPKVDQEAAFTMLLSDISWNNFMGQLAVGKVLSGKVTKNQRLHHFSRDRIDEAPDRFSASHLMVFEGLGKKETQEISAGDFAIIAGRDNFQIGDTISSDEKTVPFTPLKVDPPTLKVIFTINTSPLSGKEGKAIQARQLKERLLLE